MQRKFATASEFGKSLAAVREKCNSGGLKAIDYARAAEPGYTPPLRPSSPMDKWVSLSVKMERTLTRAFGVDRMSQRCAIWEMYRVEGATLGTCIKRLAPMVTRRTVERWVRDDDARVEEMMAREGLLATDDAERLSHTWASCGG